MLPIAICLAFLIPASIAACYYGLYTTLGWRRKRNQILSTPAQTHFALVIPAHNEERGLPATLQSIAHSDYPAEMISVLVVADNCTDATAEVARSFGATCLERSDTERRGKGYALAAGIPVALKLPSDAIMIVDADTVLFAQTLREIDRVFQTGADVVQTAVSPRQPESVSTGLIASVGAILENAVSAGRSILGGSPDLRGTGMVFRREVLEKHPWSAFGVTEDAEFAAKLVNAGIRIHFVPTAEVRNDAAPDVEALLTQRRRWRSSLFSGKPVVLWHRWLGSKPVVLAQLLATGFVVASCLPWLEESFALGFSLWLAAIVTLTAAVYGRALRRLEAISWDWNSIRFSAGLTMQLLRVTLAGFFHRQVHWERTPRLVEQTPRGSQLGIAAGKDC